MLKFCHTKIEKPKCEILSQKIIIAVNKSLILEFILGYGTLVRGGLFERSLQPVNVAQKFLKLSFESDDSITHQCYIRTKSWP